MAAWRHGQAELAKSPEIPPLLTLGFSHTHPPVRLQAKVNNHRPSSLFCQLGGKPILSHQQSRRKKILLNHKMQLQQVNTSIKVQIAATGWQICCVP